MNTEEQKTRAAWAGWSMFPQDAARAADDARDAAQVQLVNEETERAENEAWNLSQVGV